MAEPADSGPIPFDGDPLSAKTLQAINAKFDRGNQRMARMEKDLSSLHTDLLTNTAATRRIEMNTKDLLDGWTALQGALTVLEGLGRLAKPVAAIVGTLAACGAAWAAFKHWITG